MSWESICQGKRTVVSLSVLVPAVDAQSRLDDTLLSVLENRPLDAEIVVVHPASYVDPYQLQDEVRFVPSPHQGLISLLNDGIAACRGEFVNVLCPGATVEPSWSDVALQAFRDDRNVAAVAPRLKIARRRRPVFGVQYDAGRGKRPLDDSRGIPLSPTFQAGFFRTSALRFMQGFDLGFEALADVHLGLRLQAAGYRAVVAEACQIAAASSPLSTSPRGFTGGRLRARLFQLARAQGLTSRSKYARGLLSEMSRHWFGPRTLAAWAGHVAVWLEKSPSRLVAPREVGETRHDGPRPLRRAG